MSPSIQRYHQRTDHSDYAASVSRACLAFVLASSLGCGARTELGSPIAEDASVVDAKLADRVVDTGHDVTPIVDTGSDVAPPSPLCAAQDGGAPGSVCSVNVHVVNIAPSSVTCFVDTVIHTGDNGTVSYACNGSSSNWAVADFGPNTEFVGAVHDGTVVDLCTGTTFQFSDGCTWASAQRITGDVSSGTLSFTYEEQPIAGSNCLSPCSASGTLAVQ